MGLGQEVQWPGATLLLQTKQRPLVNIPPLDRLSAWDRTGQVCFLNLWFSRLRQDRAYILCGATVGFRMSLKRIHKQLCLIR